MSANIDPSKKKIDNKKVVDKADKNSRIKDLVLNTARNKKSLVNVKPELVHDPAQNQSITKYTKA